MPRVGAGTGDGLSTGAAPALLGAQDAQYLGAGTAPRRKTGQGAGAEDLLGRACRCGAAGFRAVPLPLAVPLPGDDPPTGARSLGTAALLRISTTPVAEAAHHQRNRTLFRRSPAQDPTHGGVHQRGKRGSDYLCDFQSVQRGLEKPHPRTMYTSSLTSPSTAGDAPKFLRLRVQWHTVRKRARESERSSRFARVSKKDMFFYGAAREERSGQLAGEKT